MREVCIACDDALDDAVQVLSPERASVVSLCPDCWADARETAERFGLDITAISIKES